MRERGRLCVLASLVCVFAYLHMCRLHRFDRKFGFKFDRKFDRKFDQHDFYTGWLLPLGICSMCVPAFPCVGMCV